MVYLGRLALLTFIISVALPSGVYADLNPEVQLGAVGLLSAAAEFEEGDFTDTVADYSDTSVNLGFRQKLYSNWRGQLVVGFQFPDADSELGPIFFDQVFAKVGSKSNVFKVGRSRVMTTLNEFPTLRDDDAVEFTDVLNPLSSVDDSQDTQYGNVIEYTRIFGQRFYLNVHGENMARRAGPSIDEPEADFGLNAGGASFVYAVPDSQRWNRPVLNRLGFGFFGYYADRYLPDEQSFTDKVLKNVLVTVTVNIFPDPVHFVDVLCQAIYNHGFEEANRPFYYRTLRRSRSVSTFTSIRYLYRRYERPTFQTSVGFGYKVYSSLQNGGYGLQGFANIFVRVGENFDLGVQYGYRRNSGEVERLSFPDSHRIELALIYSIGQSWNRQFDDADSLLNLEHGYIP